MSALALMRPPCYMASIDLTHAYYSVPIHCEHQKFLKFVWINTPVLQMVCPHAPGNLQNYSNQCYPNSGVKAMRCFVTLMTFT